MTIGKSARELEGKMSERFEILYRDGAKAEAFSVQGSTISHLPNLSAPMVSFDHQQESL